MTHGDRNESAKDARNERLAAALRDNLKRRKARDRALRAAHAPEAAAMPPQTDRRAEDER